ncbi:MAG: pyridoxamine 5'-phosphate oxidase family protein [Spirochaetaceae bacterium]|jgi:uncharacterized pyridoxamine 5'-phosphate oxidase family protein|nr:pyridoxamine 5'-phosphate oxidase family protein [Spirochaetaceae bacterium]
MKKRFFLLLGIGVLAVFVSCGSAPAAAQSGFTFAEGSMEEARDFMRQNDYYIATVDGDRPQARPFGTAAIFEGKLYIITSKAKDVSKQMAANPNICIVAHERNSVNGMRITAIAVNDNQPEAKQAVLAAHPGMEAIYPPGGENTQVLSLKDATATVYAYTTTQITFQF